MGVSRVLVVVFAVLSMFGNLVFARVESTNEFKPNEVIVKYKDNARRNRAMMQRLYTTVGVMKVKRFQGSVRQFEQLFLAEGTGLEKALKELESNSFVEYAQPNYIVKAFPEAAPRVRPSDDGGVPCIPGIEIPGCTPLPCLLPGWPPGCDEDGGGGNQPAPGRPPVADKPNDVSPPIADPQLSSSYGLSKIAAPDAWKAAQGSQDIVVAVIDTGVDYNHEDLSFNMWRNPNPKNNDLVGWDFIHDDNLPFDDHSHGTHCAGVIGAVGANGKGISGVNQRVSIMALKFLSAQGSGDTAGAIRAIGYAVENGAKVLSNSWGGKGDEDNKGLRDAIELAERKNVLFIAAAGNDGTDNDKDPTFPASFDAPNLISVAATDSNDKMAYFSNRGKKSVHLGAPGVDVLSTVPANKYKTMSGTSMACPFVAGAAALVWSANPGLSPAQVKQALLESVDPVVSLQGQSVTGGRLNVANAVRKVMR